MRWGHVLASYPFARDAAWVDESWGVAELALEGSGIGILSNDGVPYVKEGRLDAAWSRQANHATHIVLADTN